MKHEFFVFDVMVLWSVYARVHTHDICPHWKEF